MCETIFSTKHATRKFFKQGTYPLWIQKKDQ